MALTFFMVEMFIDVVRNSVGQVVHPEVVTLMVASFVFDIYLKYLIIFNWLKHKGLILEESAGLEEASFVQRSGLNLYRLTA